MAYVIMRTEKYKTRDKIAGLVGHHLRIPGSKLDNVDQSRSHLNVVIGAYDRNSFNKAVRDRLDTCTRKPRPDANKVVEMLLGASPEFFEGKSYDEQKSYLYDCLDYAKGVFGEANIVGAYMHFDEKTPHLSILAVPIETSMRKTKKMEREITTLNASHFFAGKESMIQMQTDVALFVQARGHDLLRGEPKSETNREHEPLGSYWKKQAKTIDAAVVAAADLLNDAAIEVQRYTDMRHVVELDAILLHIERGELEAAQTELVGVRESIHRQRDHLDSEWNRIKDRVRDLDQRESQVKEISRELSDERSILKYEAIHIQTEKALAEAVTSIANEVKQAANDKMTEVDELKKDITELRNRVSKQSAGFHAGDYLNQLTKKPELAGMLEFLAKNPKARELLSVMKAEPAMAEHIAHAVMVARGLGVEPDNADWSKSYSAKDAQLFADVFGTDNGLNFGP